MFFLVDAFANVSFRGNPAGVCVVNEFPCDEKLQEIAGYFNWSEIAFMKRLDDSVFQIRWFSPLDEAPLCGHATLAAAHVTFTQNLVRARYVTLKYNCGEIVAYASDSGLISMSFPTKRVSKCVSAPFNVSDVVGVDKYVEIVSDDLIYVIVLQNTRDVLRASPNFSAIKKVNCRAIAITARDGGQYDFCSRYFAPRVGIFEDPVCGSMHCRLAYYWNAILGKNAFTAYQASKRSGVLYLKLNGNTVEISGAAATVCKFDHNISWILS
jgi:PhzF family phenazine biosynthesis protein